MNYYWSETNQFYYLVVNNKMFTPEEVVDHFPDFLKEAKDNYRRVASKFLFGEDFTNVWLKHLLLYNALFEAEKAYQQYLVDNTPSGKSYKKAENHYNEVFVAAENMWKKW